MSSRRCIPGKTHYFYFTTRTTAGVPFALSGGTIKAYNVTAGTTEFTTGITLNADYDGKTGLNQVVVDMTDATAYPFSEDFVLWIQAGTVNSVSVVGEVVAEFNTRLNNEGVVQAGILVDAGTDTTHFVLPTGRSAGVTAGMVLYVDGIGARYIATYDSGTGAGTVTTAFASDPSLVFARVFVAAPGDTAAPVPATLNTALAAPTGMIGATPTGDAILAILGMMFRNKITEDGSTMTLYADDGSTVVATWATSVSGGTVTRAEGA